MTDKASVIAIDKPIKTGKRIPIIECFGPTIQGEGLMTGQVTHFLRTGGCSLKCSWCDSMYAVDPKQVKENATYLLSPQILDLVTALPHAPWLTLTGGDPCMHKGLGDIIFALEVQGMRIAVETQGMLFPNWLTKCDVVTFSPKPPSSGKIVDPTDLRLWLQDNRSSFKGRICIKIVVFDEQDYAYARHLYDVIPSTWYDSFYFTAGTILDTVDDGVLNKWVVRSLDVLQNTSALTDLLLQDITVNGFAPNEKVPSLSTRCHFPPVGSMRAGHGIVHSVVFHGSTRVPPEDVVMRVGTEKKSRSRSTESA